MKTMQTTEVEVGPVHYIEGPGFRDEQIKDIDVMEFAVGNVNESRDIGVQIKKGMEFYGRFCSSEMGPRKQVKTEVYGR